MKLKSVYVCSNCGETSPRWMGRCPSCGSWNTMNEDVVAEAPKAGLTGGKAAAPARQEGVTSLTAKRLSEISTTEEKSRILTGISELDRVLGGGIVLGGVVLLSGEPGVGKSTMLLQLCGAISNQHSVLYITGEESVRQVKLRAARLKVPQDNIFLAAENDVDEICGLIEKEKPDLVVIDSIQTMRCMDISSSSGTVSQVKESAARLLAVAKKQEIPMFIVGHVNKDGAIAGPKVMEHIVDTVLYFEGDKMLPYRILRAAKNRYGSTNELGMFDMTGQGLGRRGRRGRQEPQREAAHPDPAGQIPQALQLQLSQGERFGRSRQVPGTLQRMQEQRPECARHQLHRHALACTNRIQDGKGAGEYGICLPQHHPELAAPLGTGRAVQAACPERFQGNHHHRPWQYPRIEAHQDCRRPQYEHQPALQAGQEPGV